MSNPNDARRKAPRLSLIPPGPLRRLAARYGLGASIYGRDAWRSGLDLDDAIDHAIGHLLDYADRRRRFLAGERPDPRAEDGDLEACAWACMTLMEYQDAESRGTGKGYRRPRGISPARTGKAGKGRR